MHHPQQESREQWEQELRDRQRNIVFPDTVRNEGNFLRGIVYKRGRLRPVQRIGAGIFGLMTLLGAAFFAAAAIGEIAESTSLVLTAASVISGAISLLSFVVAFKLIFVAVFPGKHSGDERERQE